MGRHWWILLLIWFEQKKTLCWLPRFLTFYTEGSVLKIFQTYSSVHHQGNSTKGRAHRDACEYYVMECEYQRTNWSLASPLCSNWLSPGVPTAQLHALPYVELPCSSHCRCTYLSKSSVNIIKTPMMGICFNLTI
jgi:hypothetical protein